MWVWNVVSTTFTSGFAALIWAICLRCFGIVHCIWNVTFIWIISTSILQKQALTLIVLVEEEEKTNSYKRSYLIDDTCSIYFLRYSLFWKVNFWMESSAPVEIRPVWMLESRYKKKHARTHTDTFMSSLTFLHVLSYTFNVIHPSSAPPLGRRHGPTQTPPRLGVWIMQRLQ